MSRVKDNRKSLVYTLFQSFYSDHYGLLTILPNCKIRDWDHKVERFRGHIFLPLVPNPDLTFGRVRRVVDGGFLTIHPGTARKIKEKNPKLISFSLTLDSFLSF